MKITYQITELDYVRAYLLSRAFSMRAKVWCCIFVGLLISALFFVPEGLKPLFSIFVILVLLVGVIGYVASPYVARRYYRRHKAVREPYSVELLPEYVVISSARGSSRLKWNQIDKWRHDDTNIIIYATPKQFYIIPKTVAAQGFDIDELLLRLNIKRRL